MASWQDLLIPGVDVCFQALMSAPMVFCRDEEQANLPLALIH
jgi:hypothetical protein